MNELSPSLGEFLLYQTEDAQTRIQVRFEENGLWLSQTQMAQLYQVSVKTISEHLGNIFDEDELNPERTIRKFRIVQKLDNFLRLTRKDILDHAGKVSAKMAEDKAHQIYALYKQKEYKQPLQVEQDFERFIETPIHQLTQKIKSKTGEEQ
ncbi:MAG: hypothetical protein Q4A84_00025 [Neisseria sp.]|uniref:hypothetical protein n=1 Tax=Neisseria sp. TaxID=192066 RepID=UPI0026DC51B2|nr:hypothetical protein [Neisseria sp.]MDO4640082.1 hypothetical protein [Neisseria sp.]